MNEYEVFDKIVLEHRNSLLLIGAIVIILGIICIAVIEFYVRKSLGCKYFRIGRVRFSPSVLMILPIAAALIYFSAETVQCNRDIANSSYDTYIGEVEYTSSSVKFTDENFSVFVGKGHEIVPSGKHYGKCIYSHNSKVIVYWEETDKTE